MSMEIIIKATDQLTTIDGVPVRAWEGVTERGTRCTLFVHLIAVHKDEDSAQFDRELKEQLPPGRHVAGLCNCTGTDGRYSADFSMTRSKRPMRTTKPL